MQRRHPDEGASTTTDAVSRFVSRETGLRLRPQDTASVQVWVHERIQALGLSGLQAFELLLAQDSAVARAERRLLTQHLATGESYFFRDAAQIDLIGSTLLPELIARRSTLRRLRIWSAGCSTGEEAYTLAMMIDELRPALAGWNVQIVASDINLEALEKARQGVYAAWSFRTTDAARKARHFQQREGAWQIDQRLRDMVTFREVDLVRERFPDPDAGLVDFDLILCRNVFIYLTDEAIGAVTSKLALAVAAGGYLVTGHSELYGHDAAPLRLQMYPQSAVYQHATVAEPLPARPQAKTKANPTPPAETKLESVADDDFLVSTAWRHADRGRRADAVRACHEAMAAAPFDARPYFLLAQLAQGQASVAEAKTLLRKAVYLDPTFIAAYLELAALHAQEGNDQAARRMFRAARKEVARLTPTAVIPPYGTSTAQDILGYIERMLNRPED